MPAKASRDSVEGLVDSLLKGDKRSAGKLISLIEDDEPEAVEALARIFPHTGRAHVVGLDRKSTRLNSSHVASSYAVFCLKKKNGFVNERAAAGNDANVALLVNVAGRTANPASSNTVSFACGTDPRAIWSV